MSIYKCKSRASTLEMSDSLSIGFDRNKVRYPMIHTRGESMDVTLTGRTVQRARDSAGIRVQVYVFRVHEPYKSIDVLPFIGNHFLF